MSKAKILIIEDSPTQRGLYKKILKNEDYLLIEAEDGEEGLRKTRSELPDVVLCDMGLPKISGFELIKALKGKEETKYIPIICLTATYADIASKLKSLVELGADDYFYEPINAEELQAKVIVMLRIRGLYKDLQKKNKELEDFNEVAVGRELKMKELEKELAKYKK
ncbi:MAG: response regulator [Candidatus Margulisiibacteriota bacterium]